MQSDLRLRRQSWRVKYDENWDFAAPDMSTVGKNGKPTLLTQSQEYKRRSNSNNKSGRITRAQQQEDSEASDDSEAGIHESNLSDEMVLGTLSDQQSVSSRSDGGSRIAEKSLPNHQRRDKAAREKAYSSSDREPEYEYISEHGLAGELLPQYGRHRIVEEQSDVRSMYSVQSAASDVSRSYYGRRKTEPFDNRTLIRENLFDDSASIGRLSNYSDGNDLPKKRSQRSRRNPRQTSSTGSRISAAANPGFPHSPGTSPRISVTAPIPENPDIQIPSDSSITRIHTNGSVPARRLSHETHSVVSRRGSHNSRRESEQLSGRLSRAETDSIGSASSIIMRSQSRVSKSSGSKSLNTTDPDDEICKFLV